MTNQERLKLVYAISVLPRVQSEHDYWLQVLRKHVNPQYSASTAFLLVSAMLAKAKKK